MGKLIYKEKNGNKLTIHFCGLKFSYKNRKQAAT